MCLRLSRLRCATLVLTVGVLGGCASGTTGPAVPQAVIVQPVSADATLRNIPPVYPALSRRLGQQGQAWLKALVDTDGKVVSAEISQSSGHLALDQSALDAVRQWIFIPGKRDGVPERMWVLLPISFRLD